MTSQAAGRCARGERTGDRDQSTHLGSSGCRLPTKATRVRQRTTTFRRCSGAACPTQPLMPRPPGELCSGGQIREAPRLLQPAGPWLTGATGHVARACKGSCKSRPTPVTLPKHTVPASQPVMTALGPVRTGRRSDPSARWHRSSAPRPALRSARSADRSASPRPAGCTAKRWPRAGTPACATGGVGSSASAHAHATVRRALPSLPSRPQKTRSGVPSSTTACPECTPPVSHSPDTDLFRFPARHGRGRSACHGGRATRACGGARCRKQRNELTAEKAIDNRLSRAKANRVHTTTPAARPRQSRPRSR